MALGTNRRAGNRLGWSADMSWRNEGVECKRTQAQQTTYISFSKRQERRLINDIDHKPSVFIQRAFTHVNGANPAVGTTKSSRDGEFKNVLQCVIDGGVAAGKLVTCKLQHA